jgi:Uma2 family endonuclease
MLTKDVLRPVEIQAPQKMSYEAFLEWADEDTFAEWVDGEVILFMSVKRIHQKTLSFLYALLQLFTRFYNLGEVYEAPYPVLLRGGRSHREPDIFFVSSQNLHRLSDDGLKGPADLAIEIISDDSVQRDRRDKFKEYREAGVREYWIIDPRPGKQRADFYQLDDNGNYDLVATEDDERVESAVLLGFWLRPAWLWQIDEISPLEAFYEIRGLSAEQIRQVELLLRGGE